MKAKASLKYIIQHSLAKKQHTFCFQGSQTKMTEKSFSKPGNKSGALNEELLETSYNQLEIFQN